MRGIAIGVQQQDRDRFDAALLQRPRKRAHGVLVELLVHASVGEQPLAHFEARASRFTSGSCLEKNRL